MGGGSIKEWKSKCHTEKNSTTEKWRATGRNRVEWMDLWMDADMERS